MDRIFFVLMSQNHGSKDMSYRPDLVILLLFLFFSCNPRGKSSPEDAPLQNLLGMDVSCIDSIPGVSDNPQLVLLCSPYDCGSCLSKAFEEIRLFQKYIPSCNIQVIGVLSSPLSLQDRFCYYDYIAFDSEDVVRRKMKYVPTPVLIRRDEWHRVVWVHCPRATDKMSNVLKAYCSSIP